MLSRLPEQVHRIGGIVYGCTVSDTSVTADTVFEICQCPLLHTDAVGFQNGVRRDGRPDPDACGGIAAEHQNEKD